jgi:hypothetical protein
LALFILVRLSDLVLLLAVAVPLPHRLCDALWSVQMMPESLNVTTFYTSHEQLIVLVEFILVILVLALVILFALFVCICITGGFNIAV